MIRSTLLTLLLLLLAPIGCSDSNSLSGSYVGRAEVAPGRSVEAGHYEFSSDGKVIITEPVTGQAVELDYVVEDGKLLITGGPNGQALVMTMHDDGSIEGPMGVRLRREEE
jgi:hypothetical protein